MKDLSTRLKVRKTVKVNDPSSRTSTSSVRYGAGLDALSAKVQNLRQAQAKTASDFTALEQSVLHQAFK